MDKKEHLVCHSAQCKCEFGDFPDILKVSTQTKHYINDTNGAQKLIATDKEIGQPFTVNTFGQCKLQPTGSSFKPCQPMVTGWEGFYDKVQIDENGGYPLLESSKGICAIAGAPCISMITHGQVATPSAGNFEETPERQTITQQLNPIPTTSAKPRKKGYEFRIQ